VHRPPFNRPSSIIYRQISPLTPTGADTKPQWSRLGPSLTTPATKTPRCAKAAGFAGSYLIVPDDPRRHWQLNLVLGHARSAVRASRSDALLAAFAANHVFTSSNLPWAARASAKGRRTATMHIIGPPRTLRPFLMTLTCDTMIMGQVHRAYALMARLLGEAPGTPSTRLLTRVRLVYVSSVAPFSLFFSPLFQRQPP
jgi:hypothetical protein